mgnify:CR=1 FL=1
MDLGIKGRKAIICASSQGLGKACATSLAGEGCDVVINGRTEAKLLATAKEIEGLTGAKVTPVVADIGTEEGRAKLLAPDNGTLNNILPYRIDTDRQKFFTQRLADQEGITFEEARRKIGETVAAQRMGTTKEFGDACAFLCSVQASFISGQNLQIDGASYFGLI